MFQANLTQIHPSLQLTTICSGTTVGTDAQRKLSGIVSGLKISLKPPELLRLNSAVKQW